MKSSSG